MATSGTVGQTSFNVRKICEMAYRRATLRPSSTMNAESAEVAREHLFLMLSSWANLGISLWTQQKHVFGLTQGSNDVVLPVGTVNLRRASWRIYTRLTGIETSSDGGVVANAYDGDLATICTQTSLGGNISLNAISAQSLMSVGICPATTTSWGIVVEVSTNGSSWTQADDWGEVDFIDGEWVYRDLPVGLLSLIHI